MDPYTINPGEFNRKISIDRKAVVVDPNYGTESITWTPFARVFASVMDVLPSKGERNGERNGERERNGEHITIANRPTRIRIRYLDGLTSDMRIILTDRDNRELKIVAGPAEIGRRRYMELMAENYSTSGSAT